MFVWTWGAGHTEPGKPYLAKWMDENNNQCICPIPRPSVISFYFERSNGIDVHNMMRQKELRLEKSWVTTDGYSRLLTTIIGCNIVDCWRVYRFHCNSNHRHKDITLMTFASMLSYDMIHNNLPPQRALSDSFSIGVPDKDPPNKRKRLESVGKEVGNERKRVSKFLVSHHLLKTKETEKCKWSSTGFRTRRARCSMHGCKRRTSFFCPGCVPPQCGDKAWICKECESVHIQLAAQNERI